MKRKTLIAALAILACLIAVGCNESVATEEKRFKATHYRSSDITIFTDTVTGVQYLHYNNMYGGLTILVDADGKPLIQEGQNAD